MGWSLRKCYKLLLKIWGTKFYRTLTSLYNLSYSCGSTNPFLISFIARCLPVPLCYPIYTVPNPPIIINLDRILKGETFSYRDLLDEILFPQRLISLTDKTTCLICKILLAIDPFLISIDPGSSAWSFVYCLSFFYRSKILFFLFRSTRPHKIVFYIFSFKIYKIIKIREITDKWKLLLIYK